MPSIALQGVNNEYCLFSFLDKLSFIFWKILFEITENSIPPNHFNLTEILPNAQIL